MRVLCKPGNYPVAKAIKGDYTYSVNFLMRHCMLKIVLVGGCSSRVLGGLLRKSAFSGAMSDSRAEDTCCN